MGQQFAGDFIGFLPVVLRLRRLFSMVYHVATSPVGRFGVCIKTSPIINPLDNIGSQIVCRKPIGEQSETDDTPDQFDQDEYVKASDRFWTPTRNPELEPLSLPVEPRRDLAFRLLDHTALGPPHRPRRLVGVLHRDRRQDARERAAHNLFGIDPRLEGERRRELP